MGMYTELNCAFELKESVPEQVVETIKCMCGDMYKGQELPDHPLWFQYAIRQGL